MKTFIAHNQESLTLSPYRTIEARISLDGGTFEFRSNSVAACLDFFANTKESARQKLAEYPDVIHWNGSVELSAETDVRSYVKISTGATEFTLVAPSAVQLLELLDAVANRRTLCKTDEYIRYSASYAANSIRSIILKHEGKLNKKIFIREFMFA